MNQSQSICHFHLLTWIAYGISFSNDISLQDYISFDDELVTRSSDIYPTTSRPTIQLDDTINSDDENIGENIDENNDSEPEEPQTSNECLLMIEKIRYFFLCSKHEGLHCPNTTLFRDIQNIEDSIHIVKSNNIHQSNLEDYFEVNN